MKIAVTIPTRGAIFAETIQRTFLNPELDGSSFHVITGLALPHSHNECIRQALATDATHILFIEDDIVPPIGGVTAMKEEIAKGARYAFVDYALIPGGHCTSVWDGEKIIWSGLGCTMIDLSIFREMKEPWLDIDHWVRPDSFDPFRYSVIEVPHVEHAKDGFGGYDTWLGVQLNNRGIRLIKVKDLRCQHLRMKYLERKMQNEGLYDIERLL